MEVDINTQRGGAKYAKPPQMGRLQQENERPGHQSQKTRSLFVSPPPLPFRSVPWVSGRRSAGGGHQHPTPNAGALNTRNRRRWVDDKRKTKTGPGIPKIPDSSRMSDILPIRSVPRGSVEFRETFRGRMTSTPNALRGGTKYAKPPQMGMATKEKPKTVPDIPTITDSSRISAILPFRSVPWGSVGSR